MHACMRTYVRNVTYIIIHDNYAYLPTYLPAYLPTYHISLPTWAEQVGHPMHTIFRYN